MFGLNKVALGLAGGLLLAVLVAGGLMYWRLDVVTAERDAARTELSDYQAAAAAVIKERLAAQVRVAAENKRKAEEVKRAYEDRIARIDAALERVRGESAADRGSDSAVPGPAATPGEVEDSSGRDALLRDAATALKCKAQLQSVLDFLNRTH